MFSANVSLLPSLELEGIDEDLTFSSDWMDLHMQRWDLQGKKMV